MSARIIVQFVAAVARGDAIGSVAQQLGINKNSATCLWRKLGDACFVTEDVGLTFVEAEVDETAIGKRKKNKGRRQREATQWFVTITGTTMQHHGIITKWELCKKIEPSQP